MLIVIFQTCRMHFIIENDQTILLTLGKEDLKNLLRNALIYEDNYLCRYHFMRKEVDEREDKDFEQAESMRSDAGSRSLIGT
jgi:hypothetical protein